MAVRNFQAGTGCISGLGLKMFTDDDLDRIHLATLDILWDIGVKVESKQALEIFDGGGCTVDPNTKIVKIPASIVEDAIRSCPPTFRACARNPENDYICEKGRTGFVNFGEAPQMIDPHTKKVRLPKKADVDDCTRFLDALEQIIVFERPLTPSDVEQDVACIYNTKSFFNNCTKHGYIGLNTAENLRTCVKMASLVAGGEDKFRERPLFSTTCDPISPLVHAGEAVDVFIEACRLGVPSKINPMGLIGGTTCINIASALVTHNAEVLSMIVLGQSVRKGHPLIYGSTTGILDLKTSLAAVGAPESALFSAAIAKLAQFYQVPTWVAGG